MRGKMDEKKLKMKQYGPRKKKEEERARLKDMRRTKGEGRQTGVGEENTKK